MYKTVSYYILFLIKSSPCAAPVPGLAGRSLPRVSPSTRPQTQIGGGGKSHKFTLYIKFLISITFFSEKQLQNLTVYIFGQA